MRKLTLQMLRDLFCSNFEIPEDSLAIYELVEWDSYLPVLVFESWISPPCYERQCWPIIAILFELSRGTVSHIFIVYVGCTAIHITHLWVT